MKLSNCIYYIHCECNLILKVCDLFVNIRLCHEIKLHNQNIFNKKQNLKKLKNINSKKMN